MFNNLVSEAVAPFVSQFDLQRMVIYCDSRHAELETCCDIPSGPVSSFLPFIHFHMNTLH